MHNVAVIQYIAVSSWYTLDATRLCVRSDKQREGLYASIETPSKHLEPFIWFVSAIQATCVTFRNFYLKVHDSMSK